MRCNSSTTFQYNRQILRNELALAAPGLLMKIAKFMFVFLVL